MKGTKRENDDAVNIGHDDRKCKYKRQIDKYIGFTRDYDLDDYGVFCNGKDCDEVTIGYSSSGVCDWIFCDNCGEYYCETCSKAFKNIETHTVESCPNCKPENEERAQ